MSIELNDNLPPGWARTTLGKIGQVTRPRALPEDFPNLPFIGLEHIEPHTMKLLGVGVARDIKSSVVHFFPNDILYGRMRSYLNKVYCPDFEGLCSAEFIVFSSSNNLVSRYLLYLLNSPEFLEFAISLNTGERPRVSYEDLSVYPVNLPPLAEQKRIVDELEKALARVEDWVASLKAAEAEISKSRAEVLTAAVEGRLVTHEDELARQEGRDYETADELLERILEERRAQWEAGQLAKMQEQGKEPKNDSWKEKYQEPLAPDSDNLPLLPDGWAWATLEQLSWNSGYGISAKTDYNWPGSPVLRIPNISSGSINLDNLKYTLQPLEGKGAELEIGDLLIIRTNGSKGLIGRHALVQTAFIEPHFFASYLIRFRLNGNQTLQKWIALQWECSRIRETIESVADTTAGQYNINLKVLSTITFSIPSLSEQKRIIAEFERRFAHLDEMERQRQESYGEAQKLRHKTIKSAFLGELVLQDPQDEPAGVLLERIKHEKQIYEAERIEKRKEARKKMKTAKPKTDERRDLMETLREANRPLTPEELFRAAGYKPEEKEVEAFYAALRDAQGFAEEKQGTAVYLSATA